MKTYRYPQVAFLLVLAASRLATYPAFANEIPTTTAEHRLTIEHRFQLGTVGDPRISPHGDWIAYTVIRDDLEADETRSRIWVVPFADGEARAMTTDEQDSSHPRWSPDGQHLAFLSSRKGQPTQVFLLDRRGGEAVQVTDTAQAVKSFEWSRDSKRLVLVLRDPSPTELDAKALGKDYKAKAPPPWVIDRLQFKKDGVGYLDRRRTHLHLLDLATGIYTQLTYGDFDDTDPVWSPDGSRIAFTSNRSDVPDSNYNSDIWVVSADPAEAPADLVQVTIQKGADANPAWSPDGRHIVHTTRMHSANINYWYTTERLGVSAANGGNTRVLTEDLDRMISKPRFSADGKRIFFLLEDNGELNLARITPTNGNIERLIHGENIVVDYMINDHGLITTLISRPQLPTEVFVFKKGQLDQRSFTNRALLAPLSLGEVEKVRFSSGDGTTIESFVIKPPGFVAGRRYPTILDIHGGPQQQYDYRFDFQAQLLAAHGYLVLQPNPRGSTGYGQAFSLAIQHDWGGPDSEDVMAAVDEAIERGWSDPDRLGITGHSYGGFLTNRIITESDRFKAAIPDAGVGLFIANYGHDDIQRWWEQTLGLPWEPEAQARYERLSPFLESERITTPTLVIGGEKDSNVPISNSERLYQALKRLGVEAQLVVYPGEDHGIDRPTYVQDLHQRYLDWFDRHL